MPAPALQLREIAPAFVAMVHRIVWCTVATVSPASRPRTRILHPIWEWDGNGLRGWVGAGTAPTARPSASSDWSRRHCA
jgi:hypothetical protein